MWSAGSSQSWQNLAAPHRVVLVLLKDDSPRREAQRARCKHSTPQSRPSALALSLNLDDFADEEIEVPLRPDPAITLADLRAVLDRPILLPLGTEAKHLNEKDYRLIDGYLPAAVRITVDREFYELHADSVEFWTPGSPTFPNLDVYRTQN